MVLGKQKMEPNIVYKCNLYCMTDFVEVQNTLQFACAFKFLTN